MDTRKIIHALAYIVSKQRTKRINNIKAYKLLWLADRYNVRQYGRTITGDTYYAMPKGVVPSDAKNILEGKDTVLKKAPIKVTDVIEPKLGYFLYKAAPNLKVFSKTDLKTLDLIMGKYNEMSAEELSTLSHGFPEWKEYEDGIKNVKEKDSYKIDMELFFENYDDGKDLFLDDTEMLSVTKHAYLSHYGN